MTIRDELAREADRIEEDATHSGKAHYEAAGRWRKVHFAIGLPATLVAVGAGISAFKQTPTIGALLGFCAAALSAILTFLNAEGRASAHSSAGAAYLSLRNQARIFSNIHLASSDDIESSRTLLLKIAERRDELNATSPDIPRWAFNAARQGIKSGENRYRADKDRAKREP